MTTLSQHLSKQLGNLFYAIAKADSNLSFEEYQALSNDLTKEWAVHGTEVIQGIKEQFKRAQRETCSHQKCFKEFVNYLHKHTDEFTPEIKTLIFSTATAIAYAFSKLNKSELHYMAKLSIEFKKVGL